MGRAAIWERPHLQVIIQRLQFTYVPYCNNCTVKDGHYSAIVALPHTAELLETLPHGNSTCIIITVVQVCELQCTGSPPVTVDRILRIMM